MECPHIPELSYGQFSKRVHDKVVAGRIPIVGSLELTFRCNLSCVHCYLAHAHHGLPGKRELSYQEICGILDQVVNEGCLWLLITGGEPLLRSDFLEVYTYAKKKGLLITLFTNGTLITPQMADYLADWCPFSVEITLYGRTRETYERVTGVPGSYERCLQGIDLLLEREVPLKLKTMLMTLNRHEIWDIKAYAEGLGVEFRFDPMINAGLDGSGKPAEVRLTPEEVVGYDFADAKRLESWRELCDKLGGPPSNPEYLYICGAGVNSFHIDPYGELGVCLISRVPGYDLRQGSFHEGWYDFVPGVRRQKARDDYQCNQCELISLCGQCPGWSQLEHGDNQTAVDYLCQIAHLRAKAFGLK